MIDGASDGLMGTLAMLTGGVVYTIEGFMESASGIGKSFTSIPEVSFILEASELPGSTSAGPAAISG